MGGGQDPPPPLPHTPRRARDATKTRLSCNRPAGTSSRNSEVVHAGIYYPPKSNKADLCVRGRDMLYRYCDARNVPYRRCGKIVVFSDEGQARSDLPAMVKRARANGASDVRALTEEEVRELEPNVSCRGGGLLSPSTGIVDSHGLMEALLGDAERGGATVAYRSSVDGAEVMRGGGVDHDGGGAIILRAGGTSLLCDSVVNCAGLFAGRVSEMILGSAVRLGSSGGGGSVSGDDDVAATARRRRRQYFAKGSYYRLEGQRCPFSRLVYPAPVPGGLGVHLTFDLGGNVRFGPDVRWVDPSVIDPDDVDLSVDPEGAGGFYDEVRKYWPDLQDGALAPDYAGIRPKLVHPYVPSSALSYSSVGATDFLIEGPRDHGVPGFVNLMGIESPGLTASLALAERTVELLLDRS